LFVDHYKILGINRNSETAALKKAYRKLALKFHPDVCKLADAQIRFIEIQEAYEILHDAHKRHYYNILFDSYYQPKIKTEPEKVFETKIQNDYQQWRYAASKTAIDLAKEKFVIAKEKIHAGVGQVIGGTINFMSYIYGSFLIIGPFIGVYTSYSSIDVWDIDKNGNAIAGFIICSILSLFIVLLTILYFRNKMRE